MKNKENKPLKSIIFFLWFAETAKLSTVYVGRFFNLKKYQAERPPYLQFVLNLA